MSENQNLSVVKHESVPLGAIVLATENRIEAIERVGEWINRSGMFGTTSPEQGAVIALRCMEEGLSLAEYERTYDLVMGKSRKKALAALAEFEQGGGDFEWLSDIRDRQQASIRLKYKGRELVSTFTIEDAEQAGLLKADSGWLKNPPNMLRARAVSNGLAMIAPGLFAGTLEDDVAPPTADIKLDPTPRQTTPTPAPAPKQATAVVVEAQVVQPAQASTPVPKVAPTAPAPAPKAAPVTQLPETLQEELIAAIGAENVVIGTAYARSVNLIPPDGTLEDLSEANARKIIKLAQRFVEHARRHAEKGGAQQITEVRRG